MSGVVNHLWQSTMFAIVVAGLVWVCRRNRAAVRYWLWLAASMKFLAPFALLVWAGRQLEWGGAPSVRSLSVAARWVGEQAVQPAVVFASEPMRDKSFPLEWVLIVVWLCGMLAVAGLYFRRLVHIRSVVRSATPSGLESGVQLLSAPAAIEPGAYGIHRPLILLPAGIEQRLNAQQFRAILVHELVHIRRRDNLTAVLHMIVEAIFWFHPLVWWISARMIEERERACDEEVVRLGTEPGDYAEGILNVCKSYVESPLACVSGVTGSDLKKRVEAIMTNRIVFKLNFGKLLVLAAVGLSAVTVPFVAGIARAQESLKFEVATIKLADSGKRPDGRVLAPDMSGGIGSSNPERIDYKGVWLFNVITAAFDVRGEDIAGRPGWFSDQRYDITAKVPPGTTKEQFAIMLQNLLRERFKLTFHRETKKKDVYALVVGKKGSKLTPHAEPAGEVTGTAKAIGAADPEGFPTLPPTYIGTVARPSATHMRIAGQGVPIQNMTGWLQNATGRLVVDATGLTGKYDFKLAYERSAVRGATGQAEPGADVFAAVEVQLGLQLEERNVPVEILVIDTIDREPTAN